VAVSALAGACVWRPGGLVLDLTGKGFRLAGRLRRPVEAAFSLVFSELGHENILSQTLPGPGTS